MTLPRQHCGFWDALMCCHQSTLDFCFLQNYAYEPIVTCFCLVQFHSWFEQLNLLHKMLQSLIRWTNCQQWILEWQNRTCLCFKVYKWPMKQLWLISNRLDYTSAKNNVNCSWKRQAALWYILLCHSCIDGSHCFYATHLCQEILGFPPWYSAECYYGTNECALSEWKQQPQLWIEMNS